MTQPVLKGSCILSAQDIANKIRGHGGASLGLRVQCASFCFPKSQDHCYEPRSLPWAYFKASSAFLPLQYLAQSVSLRHYSATQDLSHIFDIHHSSRQHWIPHPVSKARDRTRILMDTSWIWFCCATMGTPWNPGLYPVRFSFLIFSPCYAFMFIFSLPLSQKKKERKKKKK